MNRYDAASTVVAGVAVGLLVFVGLRVYRDRHPQEPPPQPRRVSPDLVIGPRQDFLGDPSSPDTLVEFGDYQCGPCATAFYRLRQVLPRYRGNLRLAFRNFPLTTHPYAYRAAVAAESARALARFWPMHDALFGAAGHLSDADINRIVGTLRLDRARFARASAAARAAVDQDIRDGQALGVTATPTFFLCSPVEPRVQVLARDQLDRLIAGTTGPFIVGTNGGRLSVRPPRHAAPPRALPGIPRHETR